MASDAGSARLPPQLCEALRTLRGHTSVREVSVVEVHDGQNVLVSAEILVSLPSRYRACGVSPTDVRDREPVQIALFWSHPRTAPVVMLREDFPPTHPHLRPGDGNLAPMPCLVDGDVDEFVVAHGLERWVDQLVQWLERAAGGRLMDFSQGWEPTRRDGYSDVLIASSFRLRALARTERRFCSSLFFWRSPLDAPHFLFADSDLERFPLKKPERCKQELVENTFKGGMRAGTGLLLLASAPVVAGGLAISDEYLPDTVSNLAELRARAQQLGCGGSLSEGLEAVRGAVARLGRGLTLPLMVVLTARRPVGLIGATGPDADIELIPYALDMTTPQVFAQGERTPVRPVVHRETVTRELLQRFSGESIEEEHPVVLVGCGSIGSKLGMHLARSGLAPRAAVDRGSMWPHNLARHALMPTGRRPQHWYVKKSEALADAVSRLGQQCCAHVVDVVDVLATPSARDAVFPDATRAIINATASARVREAFGAAGRKELGARVIEVALFGQGRVGLCTAEGPERNPSTEALAAEFYYYAGSHPELQGVVFARTSAESVAVGQGCASATMRVSDARISLFAAAMEPLLLRAIREPRAAGTVYIGSTDDGVSLAWREQEVPAYKDVVFDNRPGASVQLSERAQTKIRSCIQQHPGVETGGVLIGRVNAFSGVVTVVDVLDAPSDSARSPHEFVLGTEGLFERLDAYAEQTAGALYFVGTWHSHLANVGPSKLDYTTARVLYEGRPTPAVMVIATPSGFRAIVAEADGSRREESGRRETG